MLSYTQMFKGGHSNTHLLSLLVFFHFSRQDLFQLLHWPLVERKIKEVLELFECIDIDNSGSIDATELRSVLSSMGQEPTDEELEPIRTFDCKNARCFKPSDRAAVLEAIRREWQSEAHNPHQPVGAKRAARHLRCMQAAVQHAPAQLRDGEAGPHDW